ncbi:MAG: anaerobic ribonucleoside-triphosphate reductase activating protein, partial [Thermoplasmata archaeon]|nr:anaerobic ribonucleoside-triphosphate reductase activating protein [Thermoplasmata archaeon]
LKDIVPYEFRTTLVKEFHGVDDVVEIARAIRGARAYYLQNLKIGVETIGEERFTPVDRETLEEMIKRASKFVKVMGR